MFQDMAPTLGGPLVRPIVARGAAYADYDRDGDLDVLVTENAGAAYLLRNDLEGGRSLRVHLVGQGSNRDGLSSRIVARVGAHRMEHAVRTGSGFLSVSEKEATFGLGSATQVDSLIVYWPSGQVGRYAGLEAGTEVRIVEGAATPEVVPPARNGAVAVREKNP